MVIFTFQQTDREHFFEAFHWLIISKSKEAILQQLDEAKLNINSEIHLAICDNKETDNCTIYDVYNPASEHGGELLVKVLGYYNRNDGYRAKALQNKYWLRRNMTGVTFKSAVVVKVYISD